MNTAPRRDLHRFDASIGQGLVKRRGELPGPVTLATMKIIPGTGQDAPVIPQPAPLQLRLLDVLGIDPRQLR